MVEKNTGIELSFSIELINKEFVKNIALSDNVHTRVLFEGVLGELVETSLIDKEILEVKGKNGTLRITLSEIELKKLLNPPLISSKT